MSQANTDFSHAIVDGLTQWQLKLMLIIDTNYKKINLN